MRMATWPCHSVPPHQQVPSSWTCRPPDGCARRSEGNQHLVQNHLVEHLVTGILQPFGEASGMPAVALDQIGQTGAAEGPQGRPHLDPARPARHLRRVVAGLPRIAGDEIGRARGHGGLEVLGVGYENDPAVVGHVQPFVGIGRPRVVRDGIPAARCARSGQAAAHSPKAPSTCTQESDACGRSRRSPRRIEGPGVDVAGLNADDRRRGQRRGMASGRIRPWPSTGRGRTRSRPSPSRLKAFSTLTCTSSPTITVNRRRAEQAARFDVPPQPAQQRVPRRSQGAEVGHGGPGHETDARVRRQPEAAQRATAGSTSSMQAAGGEAT